MLVEIIVSHKSAGRKEYNSSPLVGWVEIQLKLTENKCCCVKFVIKKFLLSN